MSGKLAKLLKICSIVLLLIFYFVCPAYARGGCFASGTKILSSSGERRIEDLRKNDLIIGYNFKTNRPEQGKIGDVRVIISPDSYLINKKIAVTGTHPFYVGKFPKLNIKEVRELKLGDLLIGENNSSIAISEIEHIHASVKVYNLLFVLPNHNFYADGVLVHNKGGGGGSSHSNGMYGADYKKGDPIDVKASFISLVLIFTVMMVAFIPVIFFREILAWLRFFGKGFTNDLELIEFTSTINPYFKNNYAVSYYKDDELWEIMPARVELDEQSYREFITKADLVERVSQLFIKYQDDWTRKNFTSISSYSTPSFDRKQSQIFLKSFGDNFDIVYNPKIIDIIPLSCQQAEGKYTFQLQINAEMTNFSITLFGSVLSGENYSRSFTEYWDIEINPDRQCYLANIRQSIAV
jgi:hypothetical protein